MALMLVVPKTLLLLYQEALEREVVGSWVMWTRSTSLRVLLMFDATIERLRAKAVIVGCWLGGLLGQDCVNDNKKYEGPSAPLLI